MGINKYFFSPSEPFNILSYSTAGMLAGYLAGKILTLLTYLKKI